MPITFNGEVLYLCTLRLPKQVFYTISFVKFLKFYLNFSGHPHLRICTSEEAVCISRTSVVFRDSSSSMYRSCDCLSDCNAIYYSYEVITEKMSPKHLQNYTSNGDYALGSEISIFYRENEFHGYKRVFRSEKAVFLSNIGAFLWLFLGASALSVLEVIYFFTLRFFNNLWIE